MSAVAELAPAGSADSRRPAARRRLPMAGLVVALIALANTIGWGLIVPPFHVPDEPAHLYYAQYLGETGKLPAATPALHWYSGDITQLIGDEWFYFVIGHTENRPPADAATARALAHDATAPLDRRGSGDAASASSNPPLYYLAQAGVYRAARGLDVAQRLSLMRLLSALMAAGTALCVFLFLREALPGSPLSWAVGGLLAAFEPMFGFISSGVDNDAGLYLVSAGLFLALARLLRRGLTPRRAAAVGALLGVGILVKTQVLAFVPAAALALLVAPRPDRPRARRRAWLAAAAALAAPMAIYGVLGATVWKRPLLDRVSVVTSAAPAGPSGTPTLRGQLSYLWQEFLPRLPFLNDQMPGFPLYDLWFKGLVGWFGWMDYGFPDWAYALAAGIALATAAGAAWHVCRRRRRLRARAGEAIVYVGACAGLAVAIGVVSYRSHVINGGQFEQARYLLPLLAPLALVPALAVRAAGRRWAPTVGVLLVIAAAGFSVFAQLLTLARYYG